MERVKIKDAAALLGVSEHFVRLGMQRGELPIGSAVKMSSRWTYHISPHLLEQYTGKKCRQRQLTARGSTDDPERG